MNLNFSIGNRVSGYLIDGEAFLGYIIAFKGQNEEGRDLAMVRLAQAPEQTELAFLDTCHPMPLNQATHTKESFLAAASRCSPCMYFKDSKARRDYLEGLWAEMVNFSKVKD